MKCSANTFNQVDVIVADNQGGGLRVSKQRRDRRWKGEKSVCCRRLQLLSGPGSVVVALDFRSLCVPVFEKRKEGAISRVKLSFFGDCKYRLGKGRYMQADNLRSTYLLMENSLKIFYNIQVEPKACHK